MDKDLGREPMPHGEKNIAYRDATGHRARGVVSLDENGDQSGILTNPHIFSEVPIYINDSMLTIAAGGPVLATEIYGHINKYGKAFDIQTGDDFVDVWDGSRATAPIKTYTYSSTADIDSISSSDDGDTQVYEVQGLDTNMAPLTQLVTATGQTRVALTTNLKRVFRVKNKGATTNAGDIYIFVNVATTLGVPNTLANVRAIITATLGQTQMAIYTIPLGKTGYMTQMWANLAIKQTSASHAYLWARENGESWKLKHPRGVTSTGDSHMGHGFAPYVKFEECTDLVIKADTTANASSVSAGFDIILLNN